MSWWDSVVQLDVNENLTVVMVLTGSVFRAAEAKCHCHLVCSL